LDFFLVFLTGSAISSFWTDLFFFLPAAVLGAIWVSSSSSLGLGRGKRVRCMTYEIREEIKS
jgi:hypothetical protein